MLLILIPKMIFTGRYENSYLASYYSKYQGNNYVMKIYKFYRIVDGIIEEDITYPSYKLWKQIAYDLNMPGMDDKTFYASFRSWFNRTNKSLIQKTASDCPFKRCGNLYINGIHYNTMPLDKESLFWKYNETNELNDIPKDKDGNCYIIANKIKVMLDPDFYDLDAIYDLPF